MPKTCIHDCRTSSAVCLRSGTSHDRTGPSLPSYEHLANEHTETRSMPVKDSVDVPHRIGDLFMDLVWVIV